MTIKEALRLILNPRAKYADRATAVADLSLEDQLDTGRPRLRLYHFTRNGPFMIGFIISLILIFLVLFGPLVVEHDPNITAQTIIPYYDAELKEMISPPFLPSADHWLGTDRWGNDMWSLIVHGARVTLVIGLYITLVRVVLGMILGSLAGWQEGQWLDRFVMGSINIISSVPILISSMVLILALNIDKGMGVFLIALSVVGWTEVAQYVRGELLVIKHLGYIESAEAVGLSQRQVLVRHALPNVLPQLLVITFLEMGAVLILLAELGFLGIFIGGGSRFSMGDFGAPNPITLIDVPEWGALVAQGAPFLRSYPHLVLAPAMAFFIAIAGVNTFSEGLRRVLERAPFSTAFLLKKRMVLVVALFVFLTALVMDYTGTRLSYARTAATFDGAMAQEHVNTLADMAGRGVGQQGSLDAADYIEERFREYEVDRGSALPLSTTYRHVITTTISRPVTQPTLAIVDEQGQVVRAFQHQQAFGYMLGGRAGSGTALADLVYVGLTGGPTAVYDDLYVRNKIVLINDSAPADFATEAMRRGAQGVIRLSASSSVRSQLQVDGANPLQVPSLPVFRVSTAVADAILQANNLTWEQLTSGTNATQRGEGWFAQSLPTQMQLSLTLNAPQVIEIPNMIGFLPGYDVDVVYQMVAVVAHYDGLGIDPDGTIYPAANHNGSATAVLLEIARLFDAQNVDPRRSVLLVIWGGGTLDDPEIQPYLEDRDNFRRLAAKVPALLHKTEYIIQLDLAGAGGEAIWIDPASDPILRDTFTTAFKEIDVPTTDQPANHPPTLATAATIPTIYLQWADANLDPLTDTAEAIDPAKLQQMGQGVARGLVELVREKFYGD